eukprot:6489992-Amphidinium_carterae.1
MAVLADDVNAQWSEALQTGSGVLDAAELILRSCWVIDLPVVPSVDDDEEVGSVAYAEAKVFALHWGKGPSMPADQMLLALPLHAASDIEGQECEVCLYQVGALHSSEVCEVKMLLLPAFYLVRRLVEGVPQTAEVLTFSGAGNGALPSACELYNMFEVPAASSLGAWLSLTGGDETSGDPDLTSTVKLLMRTSTGEAFDELYVSASEGTLTGDPRSMVAGPDPVANVGRAFLGRGASASAPAATAVAKRAASTGKGPAKAGSGIHSVPAFPKVEGVRDRAVAAVTKVSSAAGDGARAAQPKKPKTLADLAATMTSALDTFGQRLGALEAAQQRGTGYGLQGPPLQAASGPAENPSSSLLAAGRVPPKSAGIPAPLLPPGERAYRQAVQEARAVMPVVPGEPALPHGEPPGRQGRERGGDAALRLAVEQGGDTAATAVQLAMLETLERLSMGDKRGREHQRGDTMEELLFGASGDDASAGGSEGGFRLGGGVRGVMGMQRISSSIEGDPERWSALFDQSVYRSLGSDLTGAPWSCARYGQERIAFGRHQDLKRMWYLLSSLHALHRGGKFPLLGARIAQYLKAVEVATTMGGSWSVAWPLTGVADPDPSSSVHGGLTTPLEVATAIAYVKDAKVLEEASKKVTGAGYTGWSNDSGASGSGRGQGGGKRGGRGSGKGGENAAPSSGNCDGWGPEEDKGRRLVSEALRAAEPSAEQLEAAILDYFSKRVAPRNRKRENLRLDAAGAQYSRSLLLGLYTVRGTGIARATKSHSDLLRLCHRLALLRPPSMQWKYFPGLPKYGEDKSI